MSVSPGRAASATGFVCVSPPYFASILVSFRSVSFPSDSHGANRHALSLPPSLFTPPGTFVFPSRSRTRFVPDLPLNSQRRGLSTVLHWVVTNGLGFYGENVIAEYTNTASRMQPRFDSIDLGCCQADGADMASKPGATVVQRGANVQPQQGC